MMTRLRVALGTGLLVFLLGGPAIAGVDGSAPFVCAVTSLFECAGDEGCGRESPEGANLPRFVRIDLAQQSVRSLDGSRAAPIHHAERADGRLLLQGGQEGRGWTLLVVESSGDMTAAVVGDEGAFVVRGACFVP